MQLFYAVLWGAFKSQCCGGTLLSSRCQQTVRTLFPLISAVNIPTWTQITQHIKATLSYVDKLAHALYSKMHHKITLQCHYSIYF